MANQPRERSRKLEPTIREPHNFKISKTIKKSPRKSSRTTKSGLGAIARGKLTGETIELAVEQDAQSFSNGLRWDPHLIWTRPVKQLPGPEEHPLLKELMISINPNPDTGLSKSISPIPVQSATLPPVHPYMPYPTLSMDHKIQSPKKLEPGEIVREATPVSEIDRTTIEASAPSTPSLTGLDAKSIESSSISHHELTRTLSKCSLTYVRRVTPNMRHSYLLHGQVWRNATEKQPTRRRHQWVADDLW